MDAEQVKNILDGVIWERLDEHTVHIVGRKGKHELQSGDFFIVQEALGVFLGNSGLSPNQISSTVHPETIAASTKTGSVIEMIDLTLTGDAEAEIARRVGCPIGYHVIAA